MVVGYAVVCRVAGVLMTLWYTYIYAVKVSKDHLDAANAHDSVHCEHLNTL